MNRSLNLVYILLRFPYLTETFVAEEIQAVQSLGLNIQIVSLLEPGAGPVQALSEKLLPQTWYAPPLWSPGLWQAQLYFLSKSPDRYRHLLATLLRQPAPKERQTLLAKRLVIFLKAVAVAHHFRNHNIDLLHAHFAWLPGAATWICARLLDLPFTTTVHAYDIYFSNDLLPLVTGQTDRIVAISEYNRQQVISSTACQPQKVSVVHCGVNLDGLPQPLQKPDQGPANGPLKLLSVGSLVAKKGHPYLLTACRLLKEQQVHFTCTIIGGGPDEPALRQQIEAAGLEQSVTLMGARPHAEIMAAYADHDLFVLASVVTPTGDRDGIPVVLMEAGAMGLPLISTEVSGIPELVRHGQTGWLVPPGDAAALAEGIMTLARDPALRARLGQAAQALVRTEFEIGRNAKRLVDIFQISSQQKSPERENLGNVRT